MQARHWILCAALLGATGVAAGAVGAHWLEGHLVRQGANRLHIAEQLNQFDTAARYQLTHALALLGVGALFGRGRGWALSLAGGAFVGGVLLFSGMLYAYVLSGGRWPWMVHVVPVGGLLLIVGWLLLAAAFCCCTPKTAE